MKFHSLLAGFGLLLSGIGGTAIAALPLAVGSEPIPSLAPMIKRVSPAVVNIATRGSVEVAGRNPLFDDPFFRRFFQIPDEQPQRRLTQALGSGVIVDAKNGIVLTNHHVIDGADEISVTLQDDRNFSAELLGSDAGSDIAVLKISDPDLTQVTLGDSEALEVGDFVVAIGNPFGFTHTVTSGIVSALGRSGLSRDGYEDFIQTDASINPGNSGGALINMRGELVGINTAIISGSGGNIGIGFAIPINMARSIMDQLLEYGEVRRGLLGVNIFTVTPQIAEAYGIEETAGALISEVIIDSAAEAAGLEAGDVIMAVNGERVNSAAELRNMIGLMRVDDEIELAFVRDGKEKTVIAKLGSRAEPVQPVKAAEIHRGLEGAEFAELNSDYPEYGKVEGVVVRSVDTASPAEQRGLQPGDIITKVNKTKISSLGEFREAAEGANSLVLTVRRGKTNLLLPIL